MFYPSNPIRLVYQITTALILEKVSVKWMHLFLAFSCYPSKWLMTLKEISVFGKVVLLSHFSLYLGINNNVWSLRTHSKSSHLSFKRYLLCTCFGHLWFRCGGYLCKWTKQIFFFFTDLTFYWVKYSFYW